jgi:formylglycine-generating enzyme required for sulfatase activity
MISPVALCHRHKEPFPMTQERILFDTSGGLDNITLSGSPDAIARAGSRLVLSADVADFETEKIFIRFEPIAWGELINPAVHITYAVDVDWHAGSQNVHFFFYGDPSEAPVARFTTKPRKTTAPQTFSSPLEGVGVLGALNFYLSWGAAFYITKIWLTFDGGAETPPPPEIMANTLPDGLTYRTSGVRYGYNIPVKSLLPVTWRIVGGALPGGLTLGENGGITGKPTSAGRFKFTVGAENLSGTHERELTIEVAEIAPPGEMVTIRGNALTWGARDPLFTGPASQPAGAARPGATQIVYAASGTPEITETLNRILDKWYPEPDVKSMTCDDALGLIRDWEAHLLYILVTETNEMPFPPGKLNILNSPYAFTGYFQNRPDGKYFVVEHYETLADTHNVNHAYAPARLAATADIPHISNDAFPNYTLKLNASGTETAVMKYIPAAGQRYLAGSPFYLGPRYQDEFVYPSNFTKSYYMMEAPVTQGMWHIVMGENPPIAHDGADGYNGRNQQWHAERPVEFAPLTGNNGNNVTEFIRRVAALNGLAFNEKPLDESDKPARLNITELRLPTADEWEFAARVGTSNPGFTQKYADQGQTTLQGSYKVKSRKPNAWGLYDMLSGGWHRVSTRKLDNHRYEVTDHCGAATGAQGNAFKAKGGYHYNINAPHMHGACDDNHKTVGSLQEGGTLVFRLIIWNPRT